MRRKGKWHCETEKSSPRRGAFCTGNENCSAGRSTACLFLRACCFLTVLCYSDAIIFRRIQIYSFSAPFTDSKRSFCAHRVKRVFPTFAFPALRAGILDASDGSEPVRTQSAFRQVVHKRYLEHETHVNLSCHCGIIFVIFTVMLPQKTPFPLPASGAAPAHLARRAVHSFRCCMSLHALRKTDQIALIRCG